MKVLLSGLAAAALAGCGGGPFASAVDGGGGDDGPARDAGEGSRPPVRHHCAAAFTTRLSDTVIDSQTPGAMLAVSIVLRDPGAASTWTHTLRVAIVQGDSELAVLAERPDAAPGTKVEVTWSPLIGGSAASVGAYALRTSYGCKDHGAPVVEDDSLAIVHAGAVAATFGMGDGLYQPLLWYSLNGVARNYWSPTPTSPVMVRGTGTGGADLEVPGGTPSPFPLVWTALDSPPVDTGGVPVAADYNLPFAVSVSTHPDVTLKVGLLAPPATAVAAAGDPPIGAPTIRARLVEGSSAGDVIVSDGATGTYRLLALPAANVGRYDLTFHLAFEYQRPDLVWRPLSSETFPLRVYGIVGPQTIAPSSVAPYVPWVAVVDAVSGWVGGIAADAASVEAAVVHGVYNDMGLHYDTVHGASFYTNYSYGFGGASFDLTGFLSRANGSTVNCSDCASIVSTYANMVGCDLGYEIIQADFPLDYIKAIGTPAFTNDPFDTGHPPGAFNYHAIAAAPTTLIYDATLHEDGDSDPSSPPFLDTEVVGLASTFYLTHLTPATVSVSHDDKTSIQ